MDFVGSVQSIEVSDGKSQRGLPPELRRRQPDQTQGA